MSAGRRPVFRFAPSPTGALHLGHARSALLNARLAAAADGRFLVRIEDIDTTRLRDDHVAGIFDDIAWLGLSWEKPVLRQSQRFAIYEEAFRRLADTQLIYPCFATRTEIAAAAQPGATDPDGAALYPGLWRGRPARDIEAARERGLPMAYRLDMQRALAAAGSIVRDTPLTYMAFDLDGATRTVLCDPARWGDVVIARKETPTSYHLSVVIDDAAQEVTHVVRGQDLEAATDLHRLLQVLLGLATPLYHHHALIVGADGRKLSKSTGSPSLADLRASGVSASDVRDRALAGISIAHVC